MYLVEGQRQIRSANAGRDPPLNPWSTGRAGGNMGWWKRARPSRRACDKGGGAASTAAFGAAGSAGGRVPHT